MTDNNSDFLDNNDPISEERLAEVKASLEKLVGSDSSIEETDMVETILQGYLSSVLDGTGAEVTIERIIKQLATNQEFWMREICERLSRQEEMLDRQYRELQDLQEQISERNDWYEARIEKQKNTGFAVMLGFIIAGYLAIFHLLLNPSPPKTYNQLEQDAQDFVKDQEAQEERDELEGRAAPTVHPANGREPIRYQQK